MCITLLRKIYTDTASRMLQFQFKGREILRQLRWQSPNKTAVWTAPELSALLSLPRLLTCRAAFVGSFHINEFAVRVPSATHLVNIDGIMALTFYERGSVEVIISRGVAAPHCLILRSQCPCPGKMWWVTLLWTSLSLLHNLQVLKMQFYTIEHKNLIIHGKSKQTFQVLCAAGLSFLCNVAVTPVMKARGAFDTRTTSSVVGGSIQAPLQSVWNSSTFLAIRKNNGSGTKNKWLITWLQKVTASTQRQIQANKSCFYWLNNSQIYRCSFNHHILGQYLNIIQDMRICICICVIYSVCHQPSLPHKRHLSTHHYLSLPTTLTWCLRLEGEFQPLSLS